MIPLKLWNSNIFYVFGTSSPHSTTRKKCNLLIIKHDVLVLIENLPTYLLNGIPRYLPFNLESVYHQGDFCSRLWMQSQTVEGCLSTSR